MNKWKIKTTGEEFDDWPSLIDALIESRELVDFGEWVNFTYDSYDLLKKIEEHSDGLEGAVEVLHDEFVDYICDHINNLVDEQKEENKNANN